MHVMGSYVSCIVIFVVCIHVPCVGIWMLVFICCVLGIRVVDMYVSCFGI